VALAVDDVPAAIAACRKHGAKVLIPPTETRVCWMAAAPAENPAALHFVLLPACPAV
jgi:predicted enzyme related to lactoylglutathione lyase